MSFATMSNRRIVSMLILFYQDLGTASGLVESYGLVSTEAGLKELIEAIYALSRVRLSAIYIDLEGNNLSRHGTVSLLNILVPSRNHVYLVDVYTLGMRAFTTATDGRQMCPSGITLKDQLESNEVVKVFFDVRNDSDALFAHYGVRLRGVEDVQLMEVGSRPHGRRLRVSGLANCIKRDLSLPAAEKRAWELTKDRGLTLFAPEHGGSYAVFDKRPLSLEIQAYSVNDVRYLPRLRELYSARLKGPWQQKVKIATKSRVDESQSLGYQPHGNDKAFSPWPQE